jgi:hypothetical protein
MLEALSAKLARGRIFAGDQYLIADAEKAAEVAFQSECSPNGEE